jgi:endonuclease-3 related protein
MRRRFGHQKWWPGETPFEVCVGAILTQNTAWRNVERAISNLKGAGVLEPRAMLALPETDLAELIRPAGYFRVKTRRLRAWLKVLVEDFAGSLSRLLSGDTAAVRERLLRIYGIGPETADCMLLYAGGHLSFVVDAYTRRVFARHGWSTTDATYAELKHLCETRLAGVPAASRLEYWQDYHAQLVQVGKIFCRSRECLCDQCPLRPLLASP